MQFKFIVTVTILEAGQAEANKLGMNKLGMNKLGMNKLGMPVVQAEILNALKKELEPQSDEQATLTVKNFS